MPGIAPANIVASLVMSAGIVLLLSPALDANRLATASQMARLHAGKVMPDAFDVNALARQARAGYLALSELKRQRGADGKPGKLALRAEDALNNAYRYRMDGQNESGELASVLTERIDTYPAGKTLPAGFADSLKQDIAGWESWQRTQSCFARHQTHQRCIALLVDLDRDGREDVVLWQGNAHESAVYAQRGGQWRRVGRLVVSESSAPESVRAELATGSYATQPLRWDELRVGKTRFQVFENAE
jgi:hypothetical protein